MGTKREEKPQVDEVFARRLRSDGSIQGCFAWRGVLFNHPRGRIEPVRTVPSQRLTDHHEEPGVPAPLNANDICGSDFFKLGVTKAQLTLPVRKSVQLSNTKETR